MKKAILTSSILALGLTVSASAQTIYNYWSFNSGDATTTAVSAGSLWATDVPTIAGSFSGDGTFGFAGANSEIPSPFTAFNGTDYARGQDSVFTLDNRNNAISGSPVTMTDPTITLGLNLTNLEDFTLRMDVRPAELNGGDTASAAQSIDYNIGSGWVSSGLSISGLSVNDPNVVSLDFSSIAAIENQSSVQIRIVWDDLTTGASNNNSDLAKLEYDNVQISAVAIPEPGTFALIAGALGLGLVMLRRRRQS